MYLSSSLIRKVYTSLGHIDDESSAKVARERTSGLRYLIATLQILKEQNTSNIDLSPQNRENRVRFVECVGNVVQLAGNSYTNNFREEIEENPGYRVGNNFLTSALKRQGGYPGRPGHLLVRQNESLSLHPNFSTNLELFGAWNDYRIALGIWLARKLEFEGDDWTDERTASHINSSITDLYGEDFSGQLFSNNQEIIDYCDGDLSLADEPADIVSIINDIYSDTTTETQGGVGKNLIVYGAPGTGKSFFLNQYTPHLRTVFHADYMNSDFVGSYRPYKEDGSITYKFVPGPFIKSFISALRKEGQPQYLIIEEINRANASSVFGEVFQLLDRDETGKSEYNVEPEQSLLDFLNEELAEVSAWQGSLFIPKNLTLMATMNSADQGVELMDSAFKRRWTFKYLPIDFDLIPAGDLRIQNIIAYADNNISWINLAQGINKVLSNAGLPEDRLIGPFFIGEKELDGEDQIFESLCGKLFIYLWDDVLRHGRRNIVFDVDQSASFNEVVEGFKQGDSVFSEELNQLLSQ